MNRRLRKLTLALLVCACLPPAPTLGKPPQWHGSVKSLNLYGQEAPSGLADDYRISSNRLRLDMDWQPVASWRVEAAVDHQVLWTDPPGILPLAGNNLNRRVDLDHSWDHGEDTASRLQVDRLNLRRESGRTDVIVGRQAIGFGRILIFSPLDVIAPFAPDALDTDVRGGVDALRATYHYGLDGQLGAVAVLGSTSRYDSTLLTWSDNHAGLDLLLIGGELRGRTMIGAGLAGSLGTLGLKGEISAHRGLDVGKPGGDRSSGYTLAALEAWYRFDNGLSLILQYLHNGPGARDPSDYPAVLASAPLREGLTHLLGREYLMAAPAYELHPLVTLQGILLYNLDDGSALLRPTFDVSLGDNLALQIFWTWHHGPGPRTLAVGLPPTPRSEFGLRGDNGGLFLKWFF